MYERCVDGLAAALQGALSAAMNCYGARVSGGRVADLDWTPRPSDERYPLEGGLLVGYADPQRYDAPDAYIVLAAWAELFGMDPVPDPEPGIMRFIGVVEDWNVEVWGYTERDTPAHNHERGE